MSDLELQAEARAGWKAPAQAVMFIVLHPRKKLVLISEGAADPPPSRRKLTVSKRKADFA